MKQANGGGRVWLGLRKNRREKVAMKSKIGSKFVV